MAVGDHFMFNSATGWFLRFGKKGVRGVPMILEEGGVRLVPKIQKNKGCEWLLKSQKKRGIRPVPKMPGRRNCGWSLTHPYTPNCISHISGGEHPPNFTVMGLAEREACRRRRGRAAALRAEGKLSHSLTKRTFPHRPCAMSKSPSRQRKPERTPGSTNRHASSGFMAATSQKGVWLVRKALHKKGVATADPPLVPKGVPHIADPPHSTASESCGP